MLVVVPGPGRVKRAAEGGPRERSPGQPDAERNDLSRRNSLGEHSTEISAESDLRVCVAPSGYTPDLQFLEQKVDRIVRHDMSSTTLSENSARRASRRTWSDLSRLNSLGGVMKPAKVTPEPDMLVRAADLDQVAHGTHDVSNGPAGPRESSSVP